MHVSISVSTEHTKEAYKDFGNGNFAWNVEAEFMELVNHVRKNTGY